IPSANFHKLIECFKKHNLPLCLATVASWLTEQRLKDLNQITGKNNSQWCWHQHGRVHRNFEKDGKKQEFGPARTQNDVQSSLSKGRDRLEQLLDKDFHPVFTPPWNRCSSDTLQALADLGFKAVSRSKGARPETLTNLPDFQVNVDLHTRKEILPELALDNLLKELEQGFVSGLCGIMIHHQRMNRSAFELLDLLLGIIKNHRKIAPVHFADLP
ncbi:MAG: polysaccharide deacetylase family protein, partial [Desulfobulbaceae bacterium]|nr:polysaccharide deacetylase family protein [Desulfobulbaceae bacterium]